MSKPKKVAYIIGAGATQAEVKFYELIEGTTDVPQLSMQQITRRIFTKITSGELGTIELRNFLSAYENRDDIDIEQFISLLESSPQSANQNIAKQLRYFFRQDLQGHLSDFLKTRESLLANGLLERHLIADICRHETLTGILTTNYDDILDIAFTKILKGADYGIRCVSKNIKKYKPLPKGEKNVPLIKLHGAFNWNDRKLISLVDFCGQNISQKENKKSIWIPPGIGKRNDYYPFNLLWGRATEVLNCDIIRVIGYSLTRNDWGILSLIFQSQIRRDNAVELIDLPSVCKQQIKNLPQFKNIIPIYELEECEELNPVENNVNEDTLNPFAFWLYKQGVILSRNNIDFSSSNDFNKIYEKYATE